ncbi:MAG: hypothetical protein IBJ13_07070, partial [Sphingopyxis sp.]|nr:hypothetical protein [Sphingopyxis sp.]
VNSSQPVFCDDGNVIDAAIASQLDLMAQQVVKFAEMQAMHASVVSAA